MKRLLIILSLAVFMLGSVVSAQAVNISVPHGSTASSIFGNIAGVSQITNQDYISALISSQERYSAYILGSEAMATNIIGTMKGGSFTPSPNHSSFNYNDNGTYQYPHVEVLQNVLFADIAVRSQEGGSTTYTQLSNLGNYDYTPISTPGSTNKTGFQLFVVTAESVNISGVDFWRGTILVGFEDGRYNHKDFNDLIFALKPNTPAVPIPASAFLLVPGLAGLRVLRKKMK